ncbi:MAG: 2-dehydropantoate 2-reductase N-terminal domain-containing protein, partial [Chloroflexota bacterium]
MTEGAADGIRRVVVVGSGAIGSLVAAVLTIAGSDVTLVSRRRRDSEPHGQLRFEDTRGLSMLGVRRVIEPRAVGATPDLVVVAVKQFDLPAALVAAEAWPGAPLLTVQNGVGAEAVAAAARTSPVLAGSITAAVEPCPDGVRRLRTGGIGLASVRDADATIAWLVPALSAGGLPARVFPDAVAMKWSKLLANLVGNASSALLD